MDRKQARAIEWECQKVLRRYYAHVDAYEYEKAVGMFTPDVDWSAIGVKLDGRQEILKGLEGGLGAGTIRHMISNTVTDVIDADHATARSYVSLYSSHDIRFDQHDGAIAFEGANLLGELVDDFVRTDEGWRIAKRRGIGVFMRNPDRPFPIHTWADDEGKVAGDA